VKRLIASMWVAVMAAMAACGSVEATAPIDAAVTVDGAVTVDARVTPVDAAAVPHKVAFVTSQVYTGNLGGIAGADAKCQMLAGAAHLTGSFQAWLGNATVSASSRLAHATLPYLLVDGTMVAKDWNGLTSGRLIHAIDQTELGTAALGGTNTGCFYDSAVGLLVWTNALPDGAIANTNMTNSCGNNWNTAGPTDFGGPFGDVGLLGATDAQWTDACQSARCENTSPLYCLEQ
jgi:hypothetical protein